MYMGFLLEKKGDLISKKQTGYTSAVWITTFFTFAFYCWIYIAVTPFKPFGTFSVFINTIAGGGFSGRWLGRCGT